CSASAAASRSADSAASKSASRHRSQPSIRAGKQSLPVRPSRSASVRDAFASDATVAQSPRWSSSGSGAPWGSTCEGRSAVAEALGEAKRLLGRVDREHVVAGVHVEGGRLLVEADELEARRPILEQIDAALVVLDRPLAIALVPERSADLAVQVPDPRQVLL